MLAVMWMYRCIFWSSFVILTSVAEIKLSVSMKYATSHYYFLDQYLDKTKKLLDFLKLDRFLKENKKIWIHSTVLRKLCWMFLSQYCSNKDISMETFKLTSFLIWLLNCRAMSAPLSHLLCTPMNQIGKLFSKKLKRNNCDPHNL